MTRRGHIAWVLVALIGTAALCLLLYGYDNKYTHPATQPIGGVLILSEQDLERHPLRYLCREWELYPGKLLQPGETEGAYLLHTDIGSTEDFNQSSGTYRLSLLLPERSQEYALEMPEVFSAYRLFLDGRELLALGDPSPEHYREEIGSRMVSFSAAGQTELLLQVSDFSAVSKGMTYPPAFGKAPAVFAAREARLLLHGGLVLLALFGGAFSIGLALKVNRNQGIFMLLTCICFGVVSGYSLYHGLIMSRYFPLYAVDLSCFYGLLLLAVLLFSSLYELPRFWQRILALPCALGVVCAFLRGLWAAQWSMQAAGLFSSISLLLKFYAAIVLVGLSAWALWTRRSKSPVLLCSALAFSVCLVCDRMLPLFEPIYGGWFVEVGAALLVGALAVTLWRGGLEAYSLYLTYQQERYQLERQLAFQQEHYRAIAQQIEHSREEAHDLRHHANAIQALAQQGYCQEILRYLSTYAPRLAQAEVSTYCEHLAADAVLRHYAGEAGRLRVKYEVKLLLSHELDFPSDELCVILNNLLENAMEALMRQALGVRSLSLSGGLIDGNLAILLTNSFDGRVRQQGNGFLSHKREGFGYGLRSVDRIARRHGGVSTFTATDCEFQSSVLIPLAIPQESNPACQLK